MLPSVLDDAFHSGEVLRADGTPVPLRSNVSHDEAMRLYELVRARDPEATIEIGLAQGISTLAITQALHVNGSGAKHYVVDPFQRSRYEGVGLANLDRAGLRDHVEFFEAFPEEALPRFPVADFAFIDASHLFDFTVLDFVLVDKRLKVGGLVGFHDLWLRGLQKVVRYILTNRSYCIFHELPPAPLPPKERMKVLAGTIARRVPRADRVLRPEALTPASGLGLRESLVFVEKTGDDERDYRYYRDF
jgi:predicted O-methyltransferase YrrM